MKNHAPGSGPIAADLDNFLSKPAFLLGLPAYTCFIPEDNDQVCTVASAHEYT